VSGAHTNHQRIRTLRQISVVRTRQIQLSLHHIAAAIDRHLATMPDSPLTSLRASKCLRSAPDSVAHNHPATRRRTSPARHLSEPVRVRQLRACRPTGGWRKPGDPGHVMPTGLSFRTMTQASAPQTLDDGFHRRRLLDSRRAHDQAHDTRSLLLRGMIVRLVVRPSHAAVVPRGPESGPEHFGRAPMLGGRPCSWESGPVFVGRGSLGWALGGPGV